MTNVTGTKITELKANKASSCLPESIAVQSFFLGPQSEHANWFQSNATAISGGSARGGIQIENEAIEELQKMVGYLRSDASGHFTSCGAITMDRK